MRIYYNPKLKEYSRDLRNNSTLSEVILWKRLKGRQLLGLQFSRQKPVGNYIADFYCSKAGLIIEVDGKSHENKQEYDRVRKEYLERLGFKVLNIKDEDVKRDLENVIKRIESFIREGSYT